MHSTKISKFWAKLINIRSKERSCKKKNKEEMKNIDVKVNVNEEYKEVFRTKSYVNISNVLKGSPSTSTSTSSSKHRLYTGLPDCLLEPPQEVVLESINSSTNKHIKGLLKQFFDVTLEAYNVCEFLLRGIQITRANHRVIERVMRLSRDDNYPSELIIQELSSFVRLSNPLSCMVNGAVDFQGMHDELALFLAKLTSKLRRIKRRRKLIKIVKKVAGCGLLIAYIALLTAVLTVAIQTGIGLVVISAGLILPVSIRKLHCERVKNISVLERVEDQVDIMAKGVYILMNDFDTMRSLMTRVHDEVEHKKGVGEMCVRNSEFQEVVKETMREFHTHESVFGEELDELEEHLYLCFLTINKSRKLVVRRLLGR